MKNIKYFDAKEFNNIKEIIYNSEKEYSDNIAFVIKNEDKSKTNITYSKFLDDINRLGSSFYSMNFKGKRVAILGRNKYEWVLTHLANLLGSIISIPLDKDLKLEELENSLIRSKADIIVFDNKLIDLIEDVKQRNNTSIKEYISMSKTNGYISIPELVEKGNELILSKSNLYTEYINNEIDDNSMSILLFTSGTTSNSKAVMLSQKNIASNIYAMQCVEDIRSTDTNIAFLPFHHIFGSTCLIMMIASGVKTVFPDGLKYIKQNLKEYEVSVFVGVPILTEAIYKAILKEIEKQNKTKLVKTMIKISNILLKLHIDIRRKIFKSILDGLGGKLRLIISGGAPADELSIKGFCDLGVETVQGYGLSETSPVIAAENYFARKPGSVGLPMENVEVEIVDKDENGIGQIRIKGPNVMLGYYEMEDLTNELIKDGWFYTGDLGYFDKNGFLYITGRNKNLIVLKNGKKVFPEEIETLINRLDLVDECMVFGISETSDKNDVKLSVKIVYNEDFIKENYSDKNEDELNQIMWEQIKQINTTFPRYKHIQKLITTHIPLIKTSTKKIKRQEEMKIIQKENGDF